MTAMLVLTFGQQSALLVKIARLSQDHFVHKLPHIFRPVQALQLFKRYHSNRRLVSCRPFKVLRSVADMHAYHSHNSRRSQAKTCGLRNVNTSRCRCENNLHRLVSVHSLFSLSCSCIDHTLLQANLDPGTSLAVTQQIGSFSMHYCNL